MHKAIKALTTLLAEKGIAYHILVETKDAIAIEQRLTGIPSKTTHVVIVNEEEGLGTIIQIRIYHLAHVEDPKKRFYKLLNRLNMEYDWYRFYLDEDNDLVLSLDAVLNQKEAAEQILDLLVLGCDICKSTYPEIMRTLLT